MVINIAIDVVYRLADTHAKNIYLTVGKDYEGILLGPQINAIAGYNDKTRIEIKKKITFGLKEQLNFGIIIEDVLINNIAAIENKLQAEQAMQKMDFTLAKEKKEAERKQIDAEGIKAFQNIVSTGISKELLEWKGISATEELAKSNNTKILIIGNNKNGLPIIFSENKN